MVFKIERPLDSAGTFLAATRCVGHSGLAPRLEKASLKFMMSRSLDDSLASGESLGLALQQKRLHPDFLGRKG